MNDKSENELLCRLVMTAHLNESERLQLPLPIAASQVRAVIGDALHTGEWFRGWWFPDDSLIGFVIEFRGLGRGRFERRYEGIEGEWAESVCDFCYPSAEEAA